MRFFLAFVFLAIASAQLTRSYDRWTPAVAQIPDITDPAQNVENARARIFDLPAQNNAVLLQNEVPIGKMFIFGEPLTANITFDDGEWSDVAGGKTWIIVIRSVGALSMNIKFIRFKLPEGTALWMYGRNPTDIKGPFTELNNYESEEFGTFPIEGDMITIEYFQPSIVTEEPVLVIQHVVHGYKTHSGGGCLASGSCNINSACDPQYGGNFANQIRAGGMLLNWGGSGYCSASLINTIGNTNRQLILTAAHCGTSHTAITFNWRSSQCQPTACMVGNEIAGIVMLARFTESDYAIAEISESIPASWNVYFAGFSASPGAPTRMASIHHPATDVQKMAYAYKAGVPDRWSGEGPSTHWKVTSWDEESTTEGGSSGAPLYNENNHIVGQLHGGSASCSNKNGYDTFGALFYSWYNGMSQILNPSDKPTLETDGREQCF